MKDLFDFLYFATTVIGAVFIVKYVSAVFIAKYTNGIYKNKEQIDIPEDYSDN